MILTALLDAASPAAAEQLRKASVFTVLDAFDRGADREFFINLVSAAFSLNETLRRIEVGHQIKQQLGTPGLTQETLDIALKQLTEKAEGHRKVIAASMYQLSEMAVEGDTIN